MLKVEKSSLCTILISNLLRNGTEIRIMKSKLLRLGILFALGAFFAAAGCSHTGGGSGGGSSHVLGPPDHPILQAPVQNSQHDV